MTGPLLLREQTKLSVYAQVTRGTRIVTILGSVYSEVNIEGVAVTCVSFSSLVTCHRASINTRPLVHKHVKTRKHSSRMSYRPIMRFKLGIGVGYIGVYPTP